ncbi:Ca(2+)-dependent cysteine protease [Coemansia sp. RSA 988]|nr:Ca(2+)-dependent cysteine protease [Coemansia sp. RSA 988]
MYPGNQYNNQRGHYGGPPPPPPNQQFPGGDYNYAPPPNGPPPNGPPPMDGGYGYQPPGGYNGGGYGGGNGDDYHQSRQAHRPPPPQDFPGQHYAQNDGYGPGMGPPSGGNYGGPPAPNHFPGDGYAGGGGYGPPGQGRGGPPPPPGDGYSGGPPRFPGEGGYSGGPPRFPGEGYSGGGSRFPGDGYSSNSSLPMSGPPPPPPGRSSSGFGMAGDNYGPPGGLGMAPPMNMPVVRHRPEDIDFSGSNFPQWHAQPPPPPPPSSGNGINGHGQPTHGNIPQYSIPQELQQEASKVTLSNCRGRKRALLIGINYIGSKHLLKGCINDVHNIKQFITEHFGFKEADMVILTDDQRNNPRRMPTHDNIIKAMKWLVSDARMNDSFFFHYSGHGVTVESNKSEEIDGRDEAICPVDFEKAGNIVDDDMNAIMVRPLPRGARLTAIFDCCHSATALDLPFMYNHMGNLKNEKAITYAGKGLMAAGNLYLKGDIAGAIKGLAKSVDMAITGDGKLDKSRRTKSTLGDVIMFSGCKDDQTSADTKTELAFTGAMSHALISSMNNKPHQTYVQLLQDIRRRLATKYTQVPQLSTGRLMDVNTTFLM